MKKLIGRLLLMALVTYFLTKTSIGLFLEHPALTIFVVATIAVTWLAFTLSKTGGTHERYLNKNGYWVLVPGHILEHRHIAQQVLGRKLFRNEVVHHINGQRKDNRIQNLCVMDGEKHEHFHAWLYWKKEKQGSYPSIPSQRATLTKEYGGTLLTSVPPKKRRENRLNLDARLERRIQEELFQELRRARWEISRYLKVPAYQVFNDKTLREMAEMMPETEDEMLSIVGVGPAKLQQYGEDFIEVVKRFRGQIAPDPDGKRRSA